MTTTPETLSTRLRAAADDIAFQGRPDPHDDKKLLREAACELETSATRRAHFGRLADRYASESAHLFRLLHAIAALDPDDTQMSKVEFRGKVRELAQQRMDPGVGAQPGDQWTELDSLRTSVAAQCEHHHELGQYIVAVHKPGLVDEAAVAILDGYHVGATQVAGGGAGEPGEHTLAAALRLLKLAHERGAFSAFFPAHTVMQPLGDCLNALMADPELALECFPLKPDGSRQLEGEGGIEMAVRLLKLAASRGAYARGEQAFKHTPTPHPMDVAEGAPAFAEINLNARRLALALLSELDKITAAIDGTAVYLDLTALREAIEGLTQLTRGMGAGDDGPVMAIGVAEALAEDARSAARNLDSYLARTEVGEDVSTIGEAVTMLRVLADLADPQGEDGFTEPTEPAQPGVAVFDADPASAQVEFFRDLQDRGADKGPVSDAPEQDPAARKMV
jgi:hypothetical protein